MISVRDLTFAYPGASTVLHGVSLELAQGRTLGLLGVNGCGKSTLLALLAGLFTPTSGSLSVAGIHSPGRSKALRAAVGLVLQDADLQILGSTVGEDLCLGLPGAAQDDPRARELAARFGLLDRWEDPVQTLSAGQKRKLCLAATLRLGPQALLLDEPFAGLDFPAALELRAILSAGRASGLTQVVATHDLEPVADIADEWAVVAGGRLALHGRAEDIFPRLAEFGVRPPGGWLAANGLTPWPPAGDGR